MKKLRIILENIGKQIKEIRMEAWTEIMMYDDADNKIEIKPTEDEGSCNIRVSDEEGGETTSMYFDKKSLKTLISNLQHFEELLDE